jgi:hypothetical protein
MASPILIDPTPTIDIIHFNTINGALGNQSQRGIETSPSPTDCIRAHLNLVVSLLESDRFAPSRLTSAQKQNRNNCISLLRNYMEAGVFPYDFIYDDPTTIRRPCFKDDSNNLCAVGHLIARTAGMDVVDKINNAFKFEYIRDMDHAMLAEWHVDQGLSLIELAMIQPTYPNQFSFFPATNFISTHVNVGCDMCGASPIMGIRYKCVNCPDFDLCETCEAKDNHDKSHVFLKIRRPLIAEVNNKVPLFSDLKTHEAPNQGVKQPPIQEMRFD